MAIAGNKKALQKQGFSFRWWPGAEDVEPITVEQRHLGSDVTIRRGLAQGC